MYRFIKRGFDVVFALFFLGASSPLSFLIIILSIIFQNGNPFYVQLRPGKSEICFRLIKFRTMNDLRDKNNVILPDKYRITKFGSLIRKLSLDEIPQLINVVKGDMSIVGPRPLLVKYLDYYTPEERLRHKVRPGITGWAQVNGRNTTQWNQRLAYDVYYVQNLTFLLDLKILFLTFIKVLNTRDVIIDPESIMKNLDDERKIQL